VPRVNTSDGSIDVTGSGHPGEDTSPPRGFIATTDIYEPKPEGTMVYADEEDEEPEIIAVLPATGWTAAFENGHHEPLVAFVVLDDGKAYGVAIGEDGKIDATNSVEEIDGFQRYEKER
jgi:hypothetical protein